jgi:hypothetical protein
MTAVEQPTQPHALDTARCNEIKVDMVFTLRTVLRTLSDANRTPEGERAAQDVEKALNRALVPTV